MIEHVHAALHIAIGHVHYAHHFTMPIHHVRAPGIHKAPSNAQHVSRHNPRFHYPHAGNVVPESISYP